jgi:uracil-DNA glycosylase
MKADPEALRRLLVEVRSCRLCEEQLPLGPRPVLRADERASVLIVGQAPGTRVHATGLPWNDPSGDRLRAWESYLPEFLPLPHPSPRNTRWLHVNPWFEREVVPELRFRAAEAQRIRLQ